MFKYFSCFCLGFLLFSSVSLAQEVSERAACFDSLKSEALNIADFSLAKESLEGLDYASLDADFSRYYQGHSSFGIDVDAPIFDMRVYSFGRQTGYIHPPYSPFPVGSKSEVWKVPAKEFILAEEYVRRPDGERQFLGCGMFRIAASDLKAVTRENYLYDGELSSVVMEKDGRKFWYNFNTSFDHDDQLMAYWYRLFVYPKSTQNSYFSRYDVLESFPANRLDDFALLSVEGIAAREAAGGDFSELNPIVSDGPFFLNGYYQAIVNRFPDFGQRLALRGFLAYENLQKVLASPNAEAAEDIWDTVLDSRGITRYALEQKNGEEAGGNALYDQVLNDPQAVNARIVALDLSEVVTETETVESEVVTSAPSISRSPLSGNQIGTFVIIVVLLVLLFILLSTILFFAHHRK